MRHQVIPLLPKTDYDFSSLSGPTRITDLPLVQNIDISQWGTGTLVVRLHDGTDLKSLGSFRIDARTVAPSDEEPGVFFRGPIIGTVRQSSVDLNPPSLLLTRLADHAGVAMSLFLTVDQIVTTDLIFIISIDLVVQELAVGWTPAELGSKVTLWLDQRDQIAVSGAYADWGDQSPGGTSDFTQGTAANRPVAGVTLNGFEAPSFDGTNDSMGSGILSNFISASGYHVFVVLRAVAIAGTNGTVYLNDGVIADGGAGWWGLYLKDNGGAYEAHGFHWDSGVKEAVATGFVLGADCLLEWSFDGSVIRCSLGDGGDVNTTGVGNVGSLANPVSIGTGASSSLFLNGAVAAVLVCNVRLLDTEIRNVRAYLSSRYGVTA